MYTGFSQSCLRRADGDQHKADYLFDCGYWEYYFRVENYNKYMESKKPNAQAE